MEKTIFEKEKKNRHDLGREELVRRIWEWKEQFGTRILNQLALQDNRVALDPKSPSRFLVTPINPAASGGPAVRALINPAASVDLYSVKPIDAGTLVDAAKATGGRFVVVEDHWPEGGIGDAVLAALAERGVREVRYRHLAVRKMPGSGKPAELLDAAGISTVHIVRAAKELVS